MGAQLLELEELSVAFRGLQGATEVLSRASFAIASGEIVGVVGESGSGKSVMALAVMRLLGSTGMITAGHVRFVCLAGLPKRSGFAAVTLPQM